MVVWILGVLLVGVTEVGEHEVDEVADFGEVAGDGLIWLLVEVE